MKTTGGAVVMTGVGGSVGGTTGSVGETDSVGSTLSLVVTGPASVVSTAGGEGDGGGGEGGTSEGVKMKPGERIHLK